MNFGAGLNRARGAGEPMNRASLSTALFRVLSM